MYSNITGIGHSDARLDDYIQENYSHDYLVAIAQKIASYELPIGRTSREVSEPDDVRVEEILFEGMRFRLIDREVVLVEVAMRTYFSLTQVCGDEVYEDKVTQLYKVTGTVTFGANCTEFSLFEKFSTFAGWEESLGIPLTAQLIPAVGRGELDSVAEWILDTFYPDALKKPTRIDVKTLAANTGVDIRYASLSPDGSVLGQMVFDDCAVYTYDEQKAIPAPTLVKAGTALVDAKASKCATGRVHPTIVHECSHNVINLVFFRFQMVYSTKVQLLSCPRDLTDLSDSPVGKIEKQVRQLVPRIMMPASTARVKINELITKKQEAYPTMDRLTVLEHVVTELAEFYCVSKQSAKLRMRELGYDDVEGVHNYAGRKYIPNYCCAQGSLAAYETFTLSAEDMLVEYTRNAAFRDLLDSKRFIFIESHICANNPKYIKRVAGRIVSLTDYARTHMEECCLVLTVRSNSANSFHDAPMYRKAAPLGGKIVYVGKSKAESTTTIIEPYDLALELSKIMSELPNNLSDTLKYHMEREGLTKMDLEERSYVSSRTIQRILNPPKDADGSRRSQNKRWPVRTIVALGIGLNLFPDLTMDMVLKSGNNLGCSTEENLLRVIIYHMHNFTIDECNALLTNRGYQPLSKNSYLASA